jgi:N-acetylglucosaminyldiphosphoundecaprenol N-acetyl-beta-D-mannosaminyltransferase
MPEATRYDTIPASVAAHSIAINVQRQCANVLGVSVDAVGLERAMAMLDTRLRNGPKGYVCFVGVHGILEAMKSGKVADAYQHAAMALPDGTPMVWVGRAQGLREMDHVTGPAVMMEIFQRAEFAGYSHFFYGGKPGVANELAATLTRQFPRARVAGTFTPPFRDLTPAEEKRLVAEIHRVKPDIVWVGISTPRQDLWMRRMLPRLDTRAIFGVGAAFDFLTGRIRPCPEWIKCAGLHWLHRLAQDPVRLWSRNVHNMEFLWHIALQLTGAKCYPARPRLEGAGLMPPAPEDLAAGNALY